MSDTKDTVECTKEHPWDAIESRPGVRVQHRDATLVSSRDYPDTGDEVETYRCPHCHMMFNVMVPQ